MMKNRLITLGISILFIIGFFSGCLEDNKTNEKASTKDYDIYVDVNGTADYTSIQDAINAADNGDFIFVYNGIYLENITINKSIKLIGEDKNSTIIDGNKQGNVIEINANEVSINNFNITNCSNVRGPVFVGSNQSYEQHSAIEINGNNTIICDNKLTILAGDGIKISNTNGNNIFNNYIQSLQSKYKFFYNSYSIGISIEASNKNNICNNILNNCDLHIFVSNFSNITRNEIIDGYNSIYLYICEYTKIQSNKIYYSRPSENHIGENVIIANSFNSDGAFGIKLLRSNNNIIDANNISSKIRGFILQESNNNTITKNNIFNNENEGFYISNDSVGSIIYYNNFFDNVQSAFDKGNNTWYNEDLELGNYWDDYTEWYDVNADGVADTPYNISGGNNQDKFPLVREWFVPGEILVGFNGDINQEEITTLIESYKLSVGGRVEYPDSTSVLIKVPINEEAYWIKIFKNEDNVDYAHVNVIGTSD